MRWFATILLLLAAPAARADVRATPLLDGFYRPGMCMPVRVEGTTPAKAVELSADGALPTRVAASDGRVNAVVPFLPARAIDALRIDGQSSGAKLRAVPDGVRLIGNAFPGGRSSSRPADESIVIQLDPLDPVPGPAIAWEAMDELIMDSACAERIGSEGLLHLLTFGVDVIVPGEAQPRLNLPWKREADGWTLRYEPLGPRGSVFAPVMLPVAGWQPGTPDSDRRSMLIGGALFAILATGVAMWRGRYVVLVVAALAGVTVVTLHVWQSRLPVTRWMGGSIVIQRGPFTQRDEWHYLSAAESRPARPLILVRHIAESPAALLMQPGVWEVSIPADGRIALLSRSLSTMMPLPTTPIEPTLTSPLAPLVKAGYLRPGVSVVGQVTDRAGQTIVLEATGP